LILVHSFPTNSIILNGVKEYLSSYFKVHFIDLPGFIKSRRPLLEISLLNYSTFVKEEITKLKLKDFYLGGISFGFLVVNKLAENSKCKGVIAMEPFLGSKYLRMSFVKKMIYQKIIRIINKYQLQKYIWKTNIFRKIILKDVPNKYLQIILQEIHPRTFFETAEILLTHNETIKIKTKKPYVVLLNPKDRTIDASETLKTLQQKINRDHLLVINTTAEHFPKDISNGYFEKHLKKESLEKIVKRIKVNVKN